MTQEIKDLEEFKIFKMLSEIGCVYASQLCSNKNCPKYQKDMDLRLRSRGKETTKHLTWRCNGNKCGTYKSIWDNNFEEKLSENMVSGLFEKLRQICSLSIDKKNLMLGGYGKVIEIDESLYAKVKHWKGKISIS